MVNKTDDLAFLTVFTIFAVVTIGWIAFNCFIFDLYLGEVDNYKFEDNCNSTYGCNSVHDEIIEIENNVTVKTTNYAGGFNSDLNPFTPW